MQGPGFFYSDTTLENGNKELICNTKRIELLLKHSKGNHKASFSVFTDR